MLKVVEFRLDSTEEHYLTLEKMTLVQSQKDLSSQAIFQV